MKSTRSHRLRTVTALLVAALALGACGGSGPQDGTERPDPTDQVGVVAPVGTSPTSVEIVTDWTKVDSVFRETYFRVIKVNGQCLVEEHHYQQDSISIAPVPGACEF